MAFNANTFIDALREYSKTRVENMIKKRDKQAHDKSRNNTFIS